MKMGQSMKAGEVVNALYEMVGDLKVDWHSELNPFQVLIGTVLSARTKDANTDRAASQLFSEFPDAESLAAAPVGEIEKLVKPAGFYRVKARRIKEIAKEILGRFGGETPRNMEDLVSLKGVGRKTAGCVLVYGFREPALPVDVHVHRISNRLGIVDTRQPEQTEQELMKFFDRKDWMNINELMVLFGQNICQPRKPKCEVCLLTDRCDWFNGCGKWER